MRTCAASMERMLKRVYRDEMLSVIQKNNIGIQIHRCVHKQPACNHDNVEIVVAFVWICMYVRMYVYTCMYISLPLSLYTHRGREGGRERERERESVCVREREKERERERKRERKRERESNLLATTTTSR